MKVSILTFLLVLIPSLILAEDNGGSIDARIINGQNAERGQFPYQARCVQKKPNGLTFCGGSILSDMWILTAAHCANNATGVTIYLGITHLKNLTGVFTSNVTKDGIFIHPRFNATYLDVDIALYQLKDKIPFDAYPYISSIALPTDSMMDASYVDNYYGNISGWGNTNNAGNSPLILQWARVHIMPHAQCVKSNTYKITPNMVCTDKTIKAGACPGDSGGPLAVTTPDGVLRVVGVASWIIGGCNSSATVQNAYPGSQEALPWIKSVTGIQPK